MEPKLSEDFNKKGLVPAATRNFIKGMKDTVLKKAMPDHTPKLIKKGTLIKIIPTLYMLQTHLKPSTDAYNDTMKLLGVDSNLAREVLSDIGLLEKTDKNTKETIYREYLNLLDYLILQNSTGERYHRLIPINYSKIDDSKKFVISQISEGNNNATIAYALLSQSQELQTLPVIQSLLEKQRSTDENYSRYSSAYLQTKDGFQVIKAALDFTLEISVIFKLLAFAYYCNNYAEFFFGDASRLLNRIKSSVDKQTSYRLTIADRLLVDALPDIENYIYHISMQDFEDILSLLEKLLKFNEDRIIKQFPRIGIISSLWYSALYSITKSYIAIFTTLQENLKYIEIGDKGAMNKEVRKQIENMLPDLNKLGMTEEKMIFDFMVNGIFYKVLGYDTKSQVKELDYYESLYIEHESLESIKEKIINRKDKNIVEGPYVRVEYGKKITPRVSNPITASFISTQFTKPSDIILQRDNIKGNTQATEPDAFEYRLSSLKYYEGKDIMKILQVWSFLYTERKKVTILVSELNTRTWDIFRSADDTFDGIFIVYRIKWNMGVHLKSVTGYSENLSLVIVQKEDQKYIIRPIEIYSFSNRTTNEIPIVTYINNMINPILNRNEKLIFEFEDDAQRTTITNCMLKSEDTDNEKAITILLNCLWVLDLHYSGVPLIKTPSLLAANKKPEELKTFLMRRYFDTPVAIAKN